tara:strand:- start:2951 stop:3349 length:399 start_codon:yes stop_codon:yes gene_type:complete
MMDVMKMVRKVKTQHLLVALMLVVMLFGCRCALKKMGVEGFEEVTGYDGDRMVCCLASWCGHCKSFKASGELDKLKDDPDVPVEVNEDDDEANKKYGVKGFPAILKVKEDGEQVPFKGPRTAEAMKEFFNNN